MQNIRPIKILKINIKMIQAENFANVKLKVIAFDFQKQDKYNIWTKMRQNKSKLNINSEELLILCPIL
jgi:hypothetical protein